jgi:hypothetical protein
MNDHQMPHDMLDDVAVYALGALPAAAAKRVRDHMSGCALCRQEYDALKGPAAAVGYTAESPASGSQAPTSLLKARIMRQVRNSGDAVPSSLGAPAAPAARASATPVWPAYLVAAACLAFAIISSIYNIILSGQLNAKQQEVARLSHRSTALALNLEQSRSTLSDLLNAGAKHYTVGNSDVVAANSHILIAMRGLPEPPRGHVYQAWSLPKGAKNMVPSVTFVPDPGGAAVVSVAVNPSATAAVAVSIEPEGGSKEPTTKPVLVVPLT